MWSNLNPLEKHFYEILAKDDKLRYEEELTKFQQEGGNPELLETTDRKPKKCLSAYMIFVREIRPVIVEENPNMPVLDVMKEVGKRWKHLRDKSYYEHKARADRD